MTDPIALGTFVHPFGRVAAVLWVGERYYMLEGHDGAVSFMPAIVIEPTPTGAPDAE